MKIKNITDAKMFFEKLAECKGTVKLITSQGDQLNLKSTLCQYIALTQMFTEAKIDEIELICSDPDDAAMLLEYLVRA